MRPPGGWKHPGTGGGRDLGCKNEAVDSAEHRTRVRQARRRMKHVMRLQARVGGALVSVAVVLLASGTWS
jgi:hypothetical protein